jgi:hypothetical protein
MIINKIIKENIMDIEDIPLEIKDIINNLDMSAKNPVSNGF